MAGHTARRQATRTGGHGGGARSEGCPSLPSPAGTLSAELVAHAPEGLAVIDADARFVDANPAAVLLCGLDPDDVAGCALAVPRAGRRGEARAGELTVDWDAGTGRAARVRLRARTRCPASAAWVVSFRDVTVSRQRQRRLAAIAKAASNVASKRSLVGTLETLAQEVARTDSLAGVQVLTVNSAGDRLHVMGAAGFGREVRTSSTSSWSAGPSARG